MTQLDDPRGSNAAETVSPSAGSGSESQTLSDAPSYHSSNGSARNLGETAAQTGAETAQQETILLSEVPDAEALMAEAKRAGRSTYTPAPNHANLNISPAALSALGQRYHILDEAGHGSMGNVFKARDRETGEVVAVKLLKPEIASDQAMMDRFKNELLFARKITHKNVCRVHEFNRVGSVAYTSMEFVEGESLRSVLNRFGGLPLRKGIDLALQICSGLKEAHAQGIVHRDLKPENVMVDARGNVKIMDFGIARSMESATRMTGAMVGTPAYMAPEQVGGKPVDYRTDVYSLGLILYEMFTGKQAFTADNAVAIALKQMNEQPVAPHKIEPGIPKPIEKAILKALEKEPAKRFQTVEDMERAFAPAGMPAVPTGSAESVPSTHKTVALEPTVAMPQESAVATTKTKPASRGKTLAFAAVFAFGALFVAGAVRVGRYARHAETLPPPPRPAAPKPPEFGLKTTAELAPVFMTDSQNTQAVLDASLDAPGSRAAVARESSSAMVASAASSNVTPTAAPSSQPVATDEAQARESVDAAPAGPQTMGSVLRGKGPSYIWVSRFEREERAQDASRKIQGLGLPSVVVPRPGATPAYVVFAGPFQPSRVSSVVDWLKTQGFASAREVKSLGLGQLGAAAAKRGAEGTPQ